MESSLPNYPVDLRDYDAVQDNAADDSDEAMDNVIGLTVKPGKNDEGNNFVDTDNHGSISGSVTDDADNPLFDLPLQLLTTPDNNSIIVTIWTCSHALYGDW